MNLGFRSTFLQTRQKLWILIWHTTINYTAHKFFQNTNVTYNIVYIKLKHWLSDIQGRPKKHTKLFLKNYRLLPWWISPFQIVVFMANKIYRVDQNKIENFLSKNHRPLPDEFFFQVFVDFFRHFCCSNNIYFNKLTDNRLFKVLPAGFNASIQSPWKVVNNAAKVLYFILAHPVFQQRTQDAILRSLFRSFVMKRKKWKSKYQKLFERKIHKEGWALYVFFWH
jgi:hypothetical protein